jgi:hypothetical protein
MVVFDNHLQANAPSGHSLGARKSSLCPVATHGRQLESSGDCGCPYDVGRCSDDVHALTETVAADIQARMSHVRFCPESGHRSVARQRQTLKRLNLKLIYINNSISKL